MVNFGLTFSSLIGIVLILAGAGLYFLRSWKPKLARDHDIFFAAVGLLCGCILLFQGWRLDPILAFGQFLLTGSTIFFAFESIRLRSVSTTKAKERAPIIDDERYVSDVYRVDAELDELEPTDDEYMPMARQIRGSRDSRPSRAELYDEEMARRRPAPSPTSSNRRSILDQPNPPERPQKRRPRPDSRVNRYNGSDDWETPIEQDERRSSSRSRNRRPRSSEGVADRWETWETQDSVEARESRGSRSQRSGRSSAEHSSYRYRVERIDDPADDSPNSSDYADYRPIEESDYRE